MNKLKKEELLQIEGGNTNLLTATFLNAVARCLDSLLEIGRSIGSAISRWKNGNLCS